MSIYLASVAQAAVGQSETSETLVSPAAASVLQAIESRLRESSYYYLRTIHCAFEGGVVTLRGRVPTFYLKQTAQSLVEKIAGVERVVNLVDVIDPAKRR